MAEIEIQVADEQENTTTEEVVEQEDQQTEAEEGKPEGTEGDKEEAPEEGSPAEADKIIEEVKQAEEELKADLTTKGIDFENCAKEYQEKGALSEETYTKLAEAGYTKAVVDAYIAGVEAKAEAVTNAILKSVGGQAEYDKIAAFIQAKGNAAVDAYNALVDGGNVTAISMFLNGVKAEMIYTKGTANRTILGGQGNTAVKGFESEAEMTKAMNDPRYRTDPEYAKKVALKLSKSSFVKFGR